MERKVGVRIEIHGGQAKEFGHEKLVETFNQESDIITKSSPGSRWGQDKVS